VVDASVVLKWFLPEAGNLPADGVLEGFLNGRLTLHAPDLMLIETASALWRRSVVRKQIAPSDAKAIYQDLLTLPLNFYASERLASGAFALSIAHHHSVYDAVYCALAIELDCELVTADETLVAKLGKALPFIHHLSRIKV
jgi:predicted nucleic acid-binding protein